MTNVINHPKEIPRAELTDDQQLQINNYAEKGNDEMENENYMHAIGWFNKALEVVPAPKDEWEATGWLSASVGDAYFSLENYEEGLNYMNVANRIYGAEEPNPFILLRMGQCYFHLGNEEKAKQYLLGAYMLEGRNLFEYEGLYFDFLKSKVLL